MGGGAGVAEVHVYVETPALLPFASLAGGAQGYRKTVYLNMVPAHTHLWASPVLMCTVLVEPGWLTSQWCVECTGEQQWADRYSHWRMLSWGHLVDSLVASIVTSHRQVMHMALTEQKNLYVVLTLWAYGYVHTFSWGWACETDHCDINDKNEKINSEWLFRLISKVNLLLQNQEWKMFLDPIVFPKDLSIPQHSRVFRI